MSASLRYRVQSATTASSQATSSALNCIAIESHIIYALGLFAFHFYQEYIVKESFIMYSCFYVTSDLYVISWEDPLLE